MFQPGTVLLGKYRIERVLGEGGMGVVALAHHLHLDQPVAIKFLRPEVLSMDTVVKRFLREAQAAVKLKSEHVCKVHDVGTLESGSPYMVMEYMEGVELGVLARERGRLAPGEAVEFLLQACEALAEAHALGIVHRDIKPSNLFVTTRPDGSALLKVLDFGISKAPVDVELTSTKAVMGTPAYMSPEQMRATKHVDARTDVWALGVVLYELLEGRRPFPGSVYSELCLQVCMDSTPTMSASLPRELETAVARCLEKDIERRFQNVAELAAALAPHAEDPVRAARTAERTARVLGLAASPSAAMSTGQTGVPVVSGPGDPTTLSTGSGHMAAAHPESRRRPWIMAGAAIATVAAVALVVMLVGGSGGASGNAAPSGSDVTGAAAPVEMNEQPDIEPVPTPSTVPPAVDEIADKARDAGVAADAAKQVAAEVATEEVEEQAQEQANQRETRRESSRSKDRRRLRKARRAEEREAERKSKSGADKAASPDDIFGTRQ